MDRSGRWRLGKMAILSEFIRVIRHLKNGRGDYFAVKINFTDLSGVGPSPEGAAWGQGGSRGKKFISGGFLYDYST